MCAAVLRNAEIVADDVAEPVRGPSQGSASSSMRPPSRRTAVRPIPDGPDARLVDPQHEVNILVRPGER